jgi:hypothetical protein
MAKRLVSFAWLPSQMPFQRALPYICRLQFQVVGSDRVGAVHCCWMLSQLGSPVLTLCYTHIYARCSRLANLTATEKCKCLQWHAGRNVGTGKDFTLFSLQQGIVVFETIKQRRCVCSSPSSPYWMHQTSTCYTHDRMVLGIHLFSSLATSSRFPP